MLSACETAQGQIASGEGVYGLVRALRTAGARNVLVTLRPIGDASAPRFMEAFYRHLLQPTPRPIRPEPGLPGHPARVHPPPTRLRLATLRPLRSMSMVTAVAWLVWTGVRAAICGFLLGSGCRGTWEPGKQRLVRGLPIAGRSRPSIGEGQGAADRGAGLAEHVLDPEIDLVVFDRAPKPLDEDTVPSGAPTVHDDGNFGGGAPLWLPHVKRESVTQGSMSAERAHASRRQRRQRSCDEQQSAHLWCYPDAT